MTRLRCGMTDTLDFLSVRLVVAGLLLIVLGAAPPKRIPSSSRATTDIAVCSANYYDAAKR